MAKKAGAGAGGADESVGAEGAPDASQPSLDMGSPSPQEIGAGEISAAPAEAAPNDTSATTSVAAVASGTIPDAGDGDPGVPVYVPPSWAEFRTFVLNNGHRFVRATFPDAPADLIETIWCGVPVAHHERARVMTAKSEWLEYGVGDPS